MSNPQSRRVMTAYLLGELSIEERSKLEAQYTSDEELFEELVAAEHDLVDAYANGLLSEVERKQFERHYLSTPRGRQRAKFAKSLMHHYSKVEPEAGSPELPEARLSSPRFSPVWAPGIRWSAAAILLCAVGSSLWLLVANRGLRRELKELQSSHASLEQQIQQLQMQIVQLTSARPEKTPVGGERGIVESPAPSQAVAFFTLTPGLRSGDEQNILAVTNLTKSARLRLKLDQRVYTRYEVVLETADEVPIWRQKNLRSADDTVKALFVTLPRSLLKRGDYILRLKGTTAAGKIEEVDEYGFRIVKR
jgi:hypothetical protein